MSLRSVDLKIMLWNVENLFLLSDQAFTAEALQLDEAGWQRLSTSVRSNKSLAKCRALKRAIEDEDPDILMLCEVGGIESLSNFNQLFLDSRYSPALIEGNSDRNIDVGFLIRKGLNFYFDVFTNKNRPLNFLYDHEKEKLDESGNPTKLSHKFSRDAAELHLFSTSREKPFLILLLAHLKSQLDRDRIDPMGFQRRKAELITLVDIYLELQAKLKAPILVAGDFNGVAAPPNYDSEFTDLHKRTDLTELLSWAKNKPDTATFYQVGKTPQPEGRQIDYFFASSELLKNIEPTSAQIYRFKDKQGMELDPPTTMDAKGELPSDHYPVVLKIKNLAID